MRSLALVLLVPSLALAEDRAPAPPVVAATTDADMLMEETPGYVSAYGRKGVFELGANAGMMLAPDFSNINFSPILGWFISENFELSAILGVSNISAGDDSTTVWSALVEPSYHVPVSPTTFGFIGMGVGTSYVKELGGALSVAPRIGANVMLGGRGVLTPSLSYEYTTHNAPDDNMDVTLEAVSSTVRINIGYTAMW